MSEWLIQVAYKLWGTDEKMLEYPYGPPRRGLKNRLAWEMYHLAISFPPQPNPIKQEETKNGSD